MESQVKLLHKVLVALVSIVAGTALAAFCALRGDDMTGCIMRGFSLAYSLTMGLYNGYLKGVRNKVFHMRTIRYTGHDAVVMGWITIAASVYLAAFMIVV